MRPSFSSLHLRSLRQPAFTLLASSCLLFASRAARAEGADVPPTYPTCVKEPTEAEETAAKGAFDAGQVSFQEADYDRTILYWEDAFRRDCTAVPLLLNLSRAYELSGKKRSAVNALETYLERRPEAADHAAIEKRIAALQGQIDAEDAKAKPAPAKDPEPSAEKEPSSEPAEEKKATSGGKPIWPIFLTGGGVVLLGVGIPVAIAGNNDVQSFYETSPYFVDPDGDGPLSAQCSRESGNCSNDIATAAANEGLQKPIQTRNLGIGLSVIGGAAAIGGAIVWGILWSRDDEESNTALVPVVMPGYTGLSYSGRF